MTNQFGPIVLLGSGETAAGIRRVYHWLFEMLKAEINIGILETPAGFEPNSAHVAGQIADFMTTRLQNFRPRISIIPARKRGTPCSPDDPDIIAPLLDTNVIMMGPGSPTYTVRQLQNSLAWHTLLARHRLGAALIFASAATIAVGAYALPVYEIYKVGEDLHWKSGLDFFQAFGLSLVFIPHWNNTDGGQILDTSCCYMGQTRFHQLAEMLPQNQTIVGIDEHTALIIDPQTQLCRVMGKGEVTLIKDDRQQRFDKSQRFSIDRLGPFHTAAEVQEIIPAEVWNSAVTADDEGHEQPTEDKPIPPEILTLVHLRTEARARQDWAEADKYRDEIEAQGWTVFDTPEGPRLEAI